MKKVKSAILFGTFRPFLNILFLAFFWKIVSLLDASLFIGKKSHWRKPEKWCFSLIRVVIVYWYWILAVSFCNAFSLGMEAFSVRIVSITFYRISVSFNTHGNLIVMGNAVNASNHNNHMKSTNSNLNLEFISWKIKAGLSNMFLILDLQKYLLHFNSICWFHFLKWKNQVELWVACISLVLEVKSIMCSSDAEILAAWSVFFHVLGFFPCVHENIFGYVVIYLSMGCEPWAPPTGWCGSKSVYLYPESSPKTNKNEKAQSFRIKVYISAYHHWSIIEIISKWLKIP